MKLHKLVNLLAITFVLGATVVGCKKGLDKTTPLPGQGARVNGGSPTAPLGDGAQIPLADVPTPHAGTEGFDVTDLNFDAWSANEEEFSAQTVYFDFDQSNVKAEELPKLETVASRMRDSFGGKALRIEGHCDERGTEEYNRALGERRALSVREHLIRLGMDPRLVQTVSFGEDIPADPSRNNDAYAKNRRGKIILLTPPGGN